MSLGPAYSKIQTLLHIGSVPAACSIMHQYHNKIFAVLRGSAQYVASSNLFRTRRYSGQLAWTPKKSQFAVCDTTSKLSVNKKIILSIIDKIQPSLRRTIIKGTLVWGYSDISLLIFSYIHRLGSFLGVQNFESHYFFFFFFLGGGGGVQKNEHFFGVITKLDFI